MAAFISNSVFSGVSVAIILLPFGRGVVFFLSSAFRYPLRCLGVMKCVGGLVD